MKRLLLCCILIANALVAFGQDTTIVKGVIYSTSTNAPMEAVNIVNLNQVTGTATNGRVNLKLKPLPMIPPLLSGL